MILTALIISYVCSSWIGAIAFTIVWRATRADRKAVRDQPPANGRMTRIRNSAAWRNEYIGGVMALAFWLYAIAGAFTIIRMLGLFALPWTEGVVTISLLAIGNFVEMTVAVILIFARIQMNRARDES
jgi:hypothetical protein